MENNKQNNKDEEIKKIYKQFLAAQAEISGNFTFPDPDLVDGNKKLINCKHEIIFNITARVLEQNEQGDTLNTQKICTKNYHIPVPSNKDYNVYMSAFFDHLEKCISASAKQAKESENNQ